jgi:Tfp pilus assembly protein FimT
MKRTGYTIVELLVGMGLLTSLILFCGAVCVAVHFIAKFW